MLLLTVLSPRAEACTLSGPDYLALDPTLLDDDAPAAPAAVDVEVRRGRGPVEVGGAYRSSSCDDLGSVDLQVERAPGDPDGDDDVGYRFELLSGTLPNGLELPPADAAMVGPGLSLSWIDGATDDQEAFDATVALVPVDVAGNAGDPFEITIADEGGAEETAEAGCHTAPAGLGVAGLLVVGALVRRRRA